MIIEQLNDSDGVKVSLDSTDNLHFMMDVMDILEYISRGRKNLLPAFTIAGEKVSLDELRASLAQTTEETKAGWVHPLVILFRKKLKTHVAMIGHIRVSYKMHIVSDTEKSKQ